MCPTHLRHNFSQPPPNGQKNLSPSSDDNALRKDF
jgi:hypothetical protein